MCGIVGVVGHYSVASVLLDALTALQHRGQDAAGIATLDKRKIHLYKANGLVKDVFDESSLMPLTGNVGIAHIRYPTAGCSHREEAQPMYVNSPYGIALAHNGNLTNKDALKKELFETDRRHLNTESDSEVLLNVLAHEIQDQHPDRLRPEHLFKAVEGVHQRCHGGYASIALIPTFGVVGFRDLNGIRPAILGKRESERGTQYAIASESVALDIIGFETIRDLRPGETIVLTLDGQMHSYTSKLAKPLTPCIFEYVYFARPDSMMDDISVYKARLRMGEALALKIQRLRPDHDIDVVIPVPDTSRTSALPLAYALDVKYREGFMKNRYIGRTFIMPGQEERQKSVKRKLNPIALEFRNKNVLLVDDSIVRGTTSRQIIQMARDAGARKVYLASAAPPVRYPNVYGIDMPAAHELIAHGKTEREVQEEIGADWLIYQELDDLIDACREGNPAIEQFDTSCFSGEYVTELEPGYLQELERQRSDNAKHKDQTPAGSVA